jgi:hypothetical protein
MNYLFLLPDVSLKAIINMTTQNTIPMSNSKLSGPGCIALSKYSGAISKMESNKVDLLGVIP